MNLHLDRLALRVAGISEADGRRLVQLVGDRLASARVPVRAGVAGSMRLTIAAEPAEALESMAHRIVAEMLRGLARTL